MTAPRRPRPARRMRAVAAAAALGLSLSACTQIPQSSAVRSSDPLEGTAAAVDAPQFRPPGPEADADPESVIRGFLQAGTGPQDDYAVARQFLTGAAAREWDPGRRTVVYASAPTVTAVSDDGAYRVQVEVDSVVDETGHRSMAPRNTTQAWDVQVEQTDAGPRIAAVDDGLLLSPSQFDQLYAPHKLAFYDQTFAFAVPDVRWFVNRTSAVTAVTRALLEGPSDYLTGSVTTAFPLSSGASLTGQSVPVTDGVAHVDLTEATVDGADRQRLARMRQQLELTLTGIAAVNEVDVTVEGAPLGASAEEAPPVETDPSPGSVQVGVDPVEGGLVFFQGLTTTAIGGLPDVVPLGPVDPAMTRDRTRFAFLDAARTDLYVARTDGSLDTVMTGTALTAPSVDVQGWAWTVDRGEGSRVSAVPTAPDGGAARLVTAPWLEAGESIVALRIAPGGARAALVVDDGTRRTLRVAGVVRGSDGVPTALTEPELLPTVDQPEDIGWVGATGLVATPLASSAEQQVRPELVSLVGPGRQLNPLAGLRGISPGEPGVLYAETDDDVSLLVGSSWRAQELERPLRDLAFPG